MLEHFREDYYSYTPLKSSQVTDLVLQYFSFGTVYRNPAGIHVGTATST